MTSTDEIKSRCLASARALRRFFQVGGCIIFCLLCVAFCVVHFFKQTGPQDYSDSQSLSLFLQLALSGFHVIFSSYLLTVTYGCNKYLRLFAQQSGWSQIKALSERDKFIGGLVRGRKICSGLLVLLIPLAVLNLEFSLARFSQFSAEGGSGFAFLLTSVWVFSLGALAVWIWLHVALHNLKWQTYTAEERGQVASFWEARARAEALETRDRDARAAARYEAWKQYRADAERTAAEDNKRKQEEYRQQELKSMDEALRRTESPRPEQAP